MGVGKAIGIGVASLFGGSLLKKAATPPPPVTPPVAPTVTNKQPDLDAADQQTAARLAGGRTSTMLTGAAGFEEKKDKTSKILLGH